MGELLYLPERDPQHDLYQEVSSFMDAIQDIEKQSVTTQVPPLAQKLYSHLALGDPKKAQFITHGIHGRVFRDSDDEQYSLNHETYFPLQSRTAHIFAIDRLEETQGFKILVDYEDTDDESVAELYILEDSEPFIVEREVGEESEAVRDIAPLRMNFLSSHDVQDLLNGLEIIKANLASELPFDE